MRYVVTAPLRAQLVGTQMKLTAEQLARRRGMVAPAPGADGFVVPTADFQFKAGEVIETAAPLDSKGFASLLRDADAPAAADQAVEAAAPKAAAPKGRGKAAG